MPRSVYRTAAALVSAAVTLQPAAAAASSEREILAVEDAYARAVARRDQTGLLGSLCDELSYVHATGERVDRDAYVKDTLKADSRLRSMRFPARRVLASKGVASITGTVVYDMGIERKARYSATWVKRSGRWCLAAWQNTAVRPAAD